MDIIVNVVNQKLKIASNLKRIISGSQLFVRFIFNLDDKWNDLEIFAQFTQNGNSYNQYLDVDNTVYLPSEITDGNCMMTLYGTGGDVIATTDSVILVIEKNPLIEDASSTVITEQLLVLWMAICMEQLQRLVGEMR